VNIVAALCIGVCCALIVATLTGAMPTRRRARSTWWARRREHVATWMQQAGVGVGPAPFVGGSVLAGAFALLATAALTGSVFVALVPAVAVALLPRAYFGRRRTARLREVQRAWPDGLRDVLASITAGLSLTQAVTTLAATGPAPLRIAFARFPELARVIGTGPALELVKEDLADATSDRIIEVLITGVMTGVALAAFFFAVIVPNTNEKLRDYWDRYYLTGSPSHILHTAWTRLSALHPALGMRAIVFVVLFAAGIVVLVSLQARAVAIAAAVLWIEMVLAARLRRYPFLDQRTSHFLLVSSLVVWTCVL